MPASTTARVQAPGREGVAEPCPKSQATHQGYRGPGFGRS